jgi:WD40 repeat protein
MTSESGMCRQAKLSLVHSIVIAAGSILFPSHLMESTLSLASDMTIQIWNVEMGKAVSAPFKGHINTVTSAVFSPTGQYTVSGSGDMTI